MAIKILVLHRGWVVVGNYSKAGAYDVLENAKIIRRWGTTKGLGEIAANGPTNNTVLDDAGSVRSHELGTIFILDCAEDKWSL